MYKGKFKQENENEELMGNNLIKENYEENALDKLSIKQLETDDFELHKEDRNLLRKSFPKILKKVTILKKVIDLNIITKEESKMAKHAKIDDVHIPIFNGGNYTSWEFRLLNILEYKECKEQAIRVRDATKANEVDEATWEKLDMKARNILISTVSDKQLEYIMDCDTAYKMMEKYKSMYFY